MHITFACPACAATVAMRDIESAEALECSACRARLPIPAAALVAGPDGEPRLQRCLVCPSTELFLRKDFPQRLGVGIVVAGLAASCVTWAWREMLMTFAILFGTALIDVVLYFWVPDCLTCYRCGARYSGDGVANQHGDPAAGSHQFEAFDLETHEKHRQLVARTKQLHSDPTHP